MASIDEPPARDDRITAMKYRIATGNDPDQDAKQKQVIVDATNALRTMCRNAIQGACNGSSQGRFSSVVGLLKRLPDSPIGTSASHLTGWNLTAADFSPVDKTKTIPLAFIGLVPGMDSDEVPVEQTPMGRALGELGKTKTDFVIVGPSKTNPLFQRILDALGPGWDQETMYDGLPNVAGCDQLIVGNNALLRKMFGPEPVYSIPGQIIKIVFPEQENRVLPARIVFPFHGKKLPFPIGSTWTIKEGMAGTLSENMALRMACSSAYPIETLLAKFDPNFSTYSEVKHLCDVLWEKNAIVVAQCTDNTDGNKYKIEIGKI